MKRLILLFVCALVTASCGDCQTKKTSQLSLDKFLLEKNYAAVKMKAVKTGHLIIKASINGVEGTFILDTGASHTVVVEQEKDKFHLKEKDTKDTADAMGAGGKLKTLQSTSNKIEIAGVEKNDQDIIVMNLNHVIDALSANGVTGISGVIGSDCLKLYSGIIDYKSLILYIK